MNDILQWWFANPNVIQVSLFAFVLSSLWLTEHLLAPANLPNKLQHTALNGVFVLSALPIQITMMVFCLALSVWTSEVHWGLVYLLPGYDQPLIKYGLMFVVLDLLDYVYHRTMHLVKPFWRFHLYHHSDRQIDVTTTVREHPGETFIRNCFLMLWVFLCGASPEILVLRQSAQTTINLWSHSSTRLPERWGRMVSWLFVTPNLHQVHHHSELPYTNRNFGDVFSIWDRLFGTLVHRARKDIVCGVETHMNGEADVIPLAILARIRALFARRSKAITVHGES